MGPVFRAYDPDSDRLVAIKRFQLDLPPDRVHVFVAELERIVDARLKEPCVRSIAAGITDVSAYLVQEFVAAESLDVLLRDRNAMSPPDVMRIVSGIANALDAAAAVGIEHGALHPRDVLVSSELVRVTGLGVARALEIAGGAAPSRRPYAAPERNDGREWDRRADVFSLAGLAHEMLWARRATEMGEGAADALTEVDGTNLLAMRQLFGRALGERVDDRPESAAAFAEALREACTVTTRAPRQFVRRERRTRSAASAALAEAPRLIEFEPRLPLEEAESVGPAAAVAHEPLIEAASDVGPEPVPAAAAVAPDIEVESTAQAEPVESDQPAAPASAPTMIRRARRERPTVREPLRPAAPAASIAHEHSSFGWLPVALTAIIFLAVGFAAGYGTATLKSPAVAENEPQEEIPPPVAAADIALPDPPRPEPVALPPAAAPTPTVAPARNAATRPAEGRLVIRSTPAGARVVVDGRDRGRTPLTLSQLALGPHTIRVMRDGYASGERRLVLTAGQPSQTAAFTLTTARAAQASAAPAPAVLRFESRPVGANVFLDGRLVGKTPIELKTVSAGEHAVRFELDGYSRWTSTLQVEAGHQQRVAASLDPVSARD